MTAPDESLGQRRESEQLASDSHKSLPVWYRREDYAAILLATIVLLIAGFASWVVRPENIDEILAQHKMTKERISRGSSSDENSNGNEERTLLAKKVKELERKMVVTPFKPFLHRPGEWSTSPLDSFYLSKQPIFISLIVSFIALLTLLGFGVLWMGDSPFAFAKGFAGLFLLSILAYVLAGQQFVKAYNLEYAMWALLLGLAISNTIGLPKWLEQGTRTEFFIKFALVLLGAEVLFSKLLALGLPGICISWIVTPVVLISTYLFGQYILRIPSKSLNLVISADMSVCGVSAAVATAAACKAKKEELSLAIGLSLIFTVIGIVVQPYVVQWSGMGEVIGGAWIGGTIDSTGAVAAAGEMVGPVARDVAATIKMIQNILIGAVAFGVAIYWASFVEPRADGVKPSFSEIWKRVPRFTLGFVLVSILLSWIQSSGVIGNALSISIVDGTTKSVREWLFCIAFVSIGLQSNFREYGSMLQSGKPFILYICGQALNLLLSFVMAWIVFTYWFPSVSNELMSK